MFVVINSMTSRLAVIKQINISAPSKYFAKFVPRVVLLPIFLHPSPGRALGTNILIRICVNE